MRETEIPLVRQLKLFADMSEKNFNTLIEAAFLQQFPPQVDLIHEGDLADFLYVVMEGGVELYASNRERETTMGVVRPVTTFILAAVFTDSVFLMSARTITKSRILMIPAENVRGAFEEDPAFARATVRELAAGYRTMVKAQKDLKLRTAVERLANYLLREERAQGGTGGLELRFDKRTLAALLGMTPENLSRAFGTLKAYDVQVEASKITLNDKESLNRMAKPDMLIDDPEN